jgi:enoyl-[acyl-carrier protein] reductase III
LTFVGVDSDNLEKKTIYRRAKGAIFVSNKAWAVVLGASSGFGAATAKELARAGYNICGVHLDRKNTMPQVAEIKGEIELAGAEALFFNMNAVDEVKRQNVTQELKDRGANVRVLMHSLAFGTLKVYIDDDPKQMMTQRQMDMTLDVMAHSLVYWTQNLYQAGLFAEDSRIFSMTSEGSSRVWRGYGAVSGAKAALEAHTRQLAVELAASGVSVNAIQAGVTYTPAQDRIPGAEEMREGAAQRNPFGRLTTVEDVAKTIRALSEPGLVWVTGNVIKVDGGESISF